MTYYLNNSGHRWVNIENGRRDRIPVLQNGVVKEKAIKYWEAVGNFSVPYVRTYKKNPGFKSREIVRPLKFNSEKEVWEIL